MRGRRSRSGLALAAITRLPPIAARPQAFEVASIKEGEPFVVRLWERSGQAGPEQNLSRRKEFLREFEETDAGKRPLGGLPGGRIVQWPGCN